MLPVGSLESFKYIFVQYSVFPHYLKTNLTISSQFGNMFNLKACLEILIYQNYIISFQLDKAFHRLAFDILDPYERFILLVGFYFGKMLKILRKKPTFLQENMASLGNTTWTDTARLGSIGLTSFQAVS